MIDTRREGWPAHGVEALVALYAAGEARIEPWFGEPVAAGDRVAVEWRVVVERTARRLPSRARRSALPRSPCDASVHVGLRERVRRGSGEEARTSDRALGNTAPARNSGLLRRWGSKTAFCLQIRIRELS
jgi:hypothetical protein